MSTDRVDIADLVAKLDALEKDATPGEWCYALDAMYFPIILAGAEAIFSPQKDADSDPDADSGFVVELRNAWPELRRIVVAAKEYVENDDIGGRKLDELVAAVRGEA